MQIPNLRIYRCSAPDSCAILKSWLLPNRRLFATTRDMDIVCLSLEYGPNLKPYYCCLETRAILLA
jgi:hypothetical protein